MVLLVAAACAPAAPSPAAPAENAGAGAAAPPSSLQALIDAARREGQLTFIWGEGTLGGTEGVRRLAEGFNRYYGLNLNVQFTPGPSMPQMAARVAQEVSAGRPTSTDLLVGYASSMAAAIQAVALESVDWASWAPNLQDPRLLAPGGVAVTIQTSLGGISYNTAKLRGDLVPRTLQDLLRPEYKGRIASTPYAAYFDLLATDELWGKERTFDYVSKLAEQAAGLIRCNETERLISGEFDLLALDCSQSDTLQAKARGAPLDYVVPADAPLLLYLYLGIPRTAPHPNAAKLWVNYILSREAQDILYETNFQDSHLLSGSKTARDIESVERAGAKLMTITLEFVQRQDQEEFFSRRAKVQEILNRR